MPLILNGSTGISGIDGSAGTPSYQGTDTNTGIFYPAADVLAFSTNGTEDARFDSSGNFGIGTTSPSGRFHVTGGNTYLDGERVFIGGSSNNAVINSNFSFRINIDADNTGTGESFAIGHNQASIDNNNILFLVNDSGNAGIGTISPNGRLEIVSTSAGVNTNTLFLTNASSNASTATSLVFGVSTAPTVRNATIRGINTGGNTIDLAFLTSNGDVPVERMRILNTGNILSLAGGSTTATGTGITFPATQSASTDANTLDDYEEGTWTPTISGSGGNPTITYSTRVGYYTKVGRVVTIHCGLQPNDTSVNGSGNLQFTGLPFTSSSLTDCVATGVSGVNGNLNWGTNKTGIIFAIGSNSTTINVYATQNATDQAGIPVSNFNNSTKYVFFSITYITST